MSAQVWARPDLSRQPHLKDLNDSLHDLRLNAGLPSARGIRDRIGKDTQNFYIVNHQAILDAFQKPDLPQLARLDLIVRALSEIARHDEDVTADRFDGLWKLAASEAVTQAHTGVPEDATEQDEDAEDDAPGDLSLESLKALIINAAQSLWDDKDALRVFLGVVRRSEGFAKMADALEEHRPANATFYGVQSHEFAVANSSARSELVALHRLLRTHRLKNRWSFTDLEHETRISAHRWIRWYTLDELPDREALIAFSNAARLQLEDRTMMLGLWNTARENLDRRARLEALPSTIGFDEAWEMRPSTASRLWVLAGVGGDPLAAHGPDLATGTVPAFTIAGPAGSGRSTALTTVARSLMAGGVRILLIAPLPSPLRALAGQGSVMGCIDREDFERREVEEALDTATREDPVVVVMDDAEVLSDSGASSVLRHLLLHGFDEGTALVAASEEQGLDQSLKWLSELTKAHRGLLLAPQVSTSGRLIGSASVGLSSVSERPAPGRGWLHLGEGTLLAVAVPRSS
ncbi:ATP-binding protein [Streptomyces sp. NPDC087894]|uniref:ATP-binding protein n=1 Tax=Streptomyces sp. NPDC087894 TaxID=3365816 RepID=UPI0038153C03